VAGIAADKASSREIVGTRKLILASGRQGLQELNQLGREKRSVPSPAILNAALSLVALGVSELSANSQRRAKRYVRYSRHSTQFVERSTSHAQSGGRYSHDVARLPFGSARWWDPMLREDRLTCCN
jgi:hypothetical protein